MSQLGIQKRIYEDTLAAVLKNKKAVIFDFYNTLVVDDILPIPLWELINSLGYNCNSHLAAIFEPDAFDGMLTPSYTSCPNHSQWVYDNIKQLLILSGVPQYRLKMLTEFVLNHMRTFKAKQNEPIIDIIALLRKENYRIGICSNWEYDIHPFLKACGLGPEIFDGIVTSCMIGIRKPNIKIFQAACQSVSAQPQEVLFIGDNWRVDIAGALRSGLSAAWLQYDRPSKGLNHLIPEFRSLAHLKHAFFSVFQNTPTRQ